MDTILIYAFVMKPTLSPQATISDLRSHLGFWMRFVSNHVSHAFAQKLFNQGVTVAEWVVLREMYNQTEMSPSAVADSTGLTRGAISKLVDRLVAKELVSRKESANDRRYQDIALTPRGRRLIPTLAALADENDQEYFSALSTEEHKTLMATLKKLVENKRLKKIPTD
jgi:DNA-binding MarR family transcriptional regulator